jgi:hypothetical protein
LKRRQAWFESQLDLEPECLVFIDETWAKTNMARTHRRCRRGERLRAGIPHGHWKTTTFACFTQVEIDCAVGSNSRANSSGVRPDRTRSTICRRNSGG